MALLKKYAPKVPNVLVAVLITTVISYFTGFNNDQTVDGRRWVDGGFVNLFGDPGKQRGDAWLVRHLQGFIRCWVGNSDCVGDLKPITASLVFPSGSPLARRAVIGVPLAMPSAYWGDRVGRAIASGSWRGVGRDMTVANSGAIRAWMLQFKQKGSRVRKVIEPVYRDEWQRQWPEGDIPWAWVAWWIDRQSAWNGSAINFRERRIGALQSACRLGLPEFPPLMPAAQCFQVLAQDPGAVYQAQLQRLRQVQRSVGKLVSIDDVLRLWATFYAGAEEVDRAKGLVERQLLDIEGYDAQKLLRSHWYLLLEDGDLALLLLRFHRFLRPHR